VKLQIPYNWTPRPYQLPAWEALESGHKRACLVWHRRAGKDLFCLNWIAKQAFLRKGLYWHVFPTYRQGRNAIWFGATRDGRKFLDHFPLHDTGVPNAVITRKRDDDHTMWFANGSRYQVVGADDPDRLVGANPIGVVFSEWSLMNTAAWDLLRPILAENGGWAIFIYTPRGRNHGYKILEMAKTNPNWYAQVLTVDDTKAVPMEAIEEDRASGMSEEMIQQEYWCSFDAPLVGSYYGEQLGYLTQHDRFGRVPWEPRLPVTTGWDLGVGDATAIWFAQQHHKEVRLIDYYQATGRGLEHYAKILADRPYTYNRHLAPHDIKVQELGSGKTRLEMATSLGLRFQVVPKLAVADGIQAVRALLPRCYFDEEATETGVQGLREYVKQPTGEEDPEGNLIYMDKPLHNWASNPADAFRTLAIGIRPAAAKRERLAPTLPIV